MGNSLSVSSSHIDMYPGILWWGGSRRCSLSKILTPRHARLAVFVQPPPLQPGPWLCLWPLSCPLLVGHRRPHMPSTTIWKFPMPPTCFNRRFWIQCNWWPLCLFCISVIHVDRVFGFIYEFWVITIYLLNIYLIYHHFLWLLVWSSWGKEFTHIALKSHGKATF